MDKVLKGEVFPPNAPAYDVVHQLTQLKADVEENIRKSKHRQLRSYNKKKHRSVGFKPKQRVWIRNFPQSHADKKFTAKLAQKRKGPYRVVQQLGPLNYREDVRTAHVCSLRPFYPTAEDVEQLERKRILDIFQESSEDEDFSGFLD